MIPQLLKERVRLRRIKWGLKQAEGFGGGLDYISSLQLERREAGQRFIDRLNRHGLSELTPRIYLTILVDDDNRYREVWRINFDTNFSREWFDKLTL